MAMQGNFMNELSPAQADPLASGTALRHLIEARIDELPDRYRAVYMLRGVEGLPFADVAATLGLPQVTVRVRFMRARRLLRQALLKDAERSARTAFSFAGERCDRIVAGVQARLRDAGAPDG